VLACPATCVSIVKSPGVECPDPIHPGAGRPSECWPTPRRAA